MSMQLAESLADVIRQTHPDARRVPVNVRSLAYQLGVTSIDFARLVEDGRLETDGRDARILLRENTNSRRTQFTIAHELGHLLLTEPGQASVERRLVTDSDVERFCDQFAAALLLPRDWVRGRFSHSPQKLESLRQLSRSSSTSMAASLVRLQQVAGWRRMLLQWRRVGETWSFRWGAGVPGSIHGRIRTPTAARELVGEIQRTTSQDLSVTLPLLVAGRRCDLAAEFSVRGSSAIALVEPPRERGG